ncbi:hypothetical protein V8G54_011535, partial [Vigna mungo]
MHASTVIASQTELLTIGQQQDSYPFILCVGGWGPVFFGVAGRDGEDHLHIVICEDHGWVFVGIYDGFNGPDATNFLLNNLFYVVNDELKEMLCGHNKFELKDSDSLELREKVLFRGNGVVYGCCSSGDNRENYPIESGELNLECVSEGIKGKGMNEINIERVDLSHSDVLQALSESLRKTEDVFMRTVEEMIGQNPVLAMMGSCVLVMLMKGQDVYLMNVGDSRAVLATHSGESLQLTEEHSTHVKEVACAYLCESQEVYRIMREHPDDPLAVTRGRVKGRLSVTRAFRAGFLKQ